MTGPETREAFLAHFRNRGHRELPSASLVPDRDPTTLFNSAGMQPLKPFYQGVAEPPAPRLTSSQKCFRTQDMDEVGKTDRHGTFFEMLGNFAPTGDYFKEKAIPLAWELVTVGFGLPEDRVRVTVHPTDDEAAAIWMTETGIRPQWVYRNPENWWSAGETGPCGPDSEIWWDRGVEFGCGQPDCEPDHCDRFLEFWNLVFMQFDRQPDGSLPPLPRPGIDTGMGLERMSSILQGVDSVFETDLYAPLMEFAAASERPDRVSQRLLSDHLRAMTFVISDGVLPAGEGRGYVLRRLIRRAALHARRVGLGHRLSDGVAVVVERMRDRYPELVDRAAYVREVVDAETARFDRTLGQGMDLFEKVVARNPREVPGADAFLLHDTYGFPLELTRELAEERGMTVDDEGFQEAMRRQRERSRSMTGQRWANSTALPRSEFRGYSEIELETEVVLVRRAGDGADRATEGEEVEIFLAATPFYGESGGQVGDTGVITTPQGRVRIEDTQRPGEGVVAHIGTVEVGSVATGERVRAAVDAPRRRQIARHHTATHLLHRALRERLGESAVQKGSWVGPDRATFDFPFNRAVTREELDAIAARVGEQVRAALPFHESLMPYREAVESGAMHLFEEKYGDTVRVVCFGDWTCELCGGTHAPGSADVGTVVITGESSVGAGLRRIEFKAGEAADELVRRRLAQSVELARGLGVPAEDVPARVEELRRQLKEAERRIAELRDEVRAASLGGSAGGAEKVPARVPLMYRSVQAEGADDLRGWADRLLEALGGSGVVAVAGGGQYVLKVSRDLGLDANSLKENLGRGGGSPLLVQGRLEGAADDAFERLRQALQ